MSQIEYDSLTLHNKPLQSMRDYSRTLLSQQDIDSWASANL